jgi:hypothetical protein
VDLGVAYTCMLQEYVSDVSYICCECSPGCFIWFAMAMTCFASVSDVCCKCFICCGCMLQVFHLNIAKVDMMLQMLQQDPSAATACCSCWGTVHARRMRRGWRQGCGGPGRVMRRGWRQGRAQPACMRASEAEGARACGQRFLRERGHM